MIIVTCPTFHFFTCSVNFLIDAPQFCAENVNAIVLSLPEYSFPVTGAFRVVILPSKARIIVTFSFLSSSEPPCHSPHPHLHLSHRLPRNSLSTFLYRMILETYSYPLILIAPSLILLPLTFPHLTLLNNIFP